MSTAPLDGVRVVEVSSFVAGPYAAMSLADWGADVIKVEPLEGEASRHIGPAHPGGLSATACSVNRGKRSITLDFRDPASADVILRLLGDCDVFVHNLLPNLLHRMGLSEERFRQANERLVIVSITGFGHGPDRDRPGLDPVFQAVSGLMSVTGESDGRSLRVGAPVVDVATGMLAASAALLGLLQRQRTGHGSSCTLAMSEVGLALQAPTAGLYLFSGEQPARMGNGSHFTLTDTFETADGQVVISLVSNRAWRDFCAILDDASVDAGDYPDNATRTAHYRDLHAKIEALLRQRPTQYWVPLLAQRRIPHSPVHDYRQAIAYLTDQNPDLLETSDGPTAVRTIANPVRLDGQGTRRPASRPPRAGQHTDEILTRLAVAADAT